MAPSIGGAIFGFFCLVVVVLGVMYVAAVNNQQSPITDTYGNTYSNITNTSQALATQENLTPGLGVTILIASVIVLIMVLFAFYVFSKTFMT